MLQHAGASGIANEKEEKRKIFDGIYRIEDDKKRRMIMFKKIEEQEPNR